MIVQIYEITNITDALRICGIGADHIGVVIGDGRNENEVRPYVAKEIFLGLPRDKKGVALTGSSDLIEIKKVITDTEPDIIHLASYSQLISPQDIENIKKEFPKAEVMLSIPVVGEESVVAAMMYDGICDYIQLDTKDPITGRVGITGKIHNWSISKKIVESVNTKVILAGGLGPENVVEAIRKVNPYGVNSKTLTDKPGGTEKDLLKIKSFVELAKSNSTL